MPDFESAASHAVTSQESSTEDLLKTQTVGLVNLDDYRKRRRDLQEASRYVELSHMDKQRSFAKHKNMTLGTEGGDADSDIAFTKKKRKTVGRKLLSFDNDEEEGNGCGTAIEKQSRNKTSQQGLSGDGLAGDFRRPIKRNPSVGLLAPKAMTKASLAAEATERERLRAEFVKIQEHVRNSDVAIPFVFYDGSNTPGGIVKVKKGEHIWLFLERCRKLGAEMGVSGEGNADGCGSKQRVEGKKSWARIGVDDLMLIRGHTIVPHHYEFYYFIANRVADPDQPSRLLFEYAGTMPSKDEQQVLLRVRGKEKLEGEDDDPASTKVVDRRWYEKNKHIYPASLWREYKAGIDKDELKDGRRDVQGNDYFFA